MASETRAGTVLSSNAIGEVFLGVTTTGTARGVQVTNDGELVLDTDDTLLSKMDELIYQVKLLRLGLCAANDSVCVDMEGEFSPETTSEV